MRCAAMSQLLCANVVQVILLVTWFCAELVQGNAVKYEMPGANRECKDQLKISVILPDKHLVQIELLETSREFLGSEPTKQQLENTLSLHKLNCFYQGAEVEQNGLAVFKLFGFYMSGTFSYNDSVYEVRNEQFSSDSPLQAAPLQQSGVRTCSVGKKHSLTEHTAGLKGSRVKRSVKLDTHKNRTHFGQYYISLILVGDRYFYQNQSSDVTAATNRLWEIGNYVNALYKQLGIHVITVQTIVWTTDPYTVDSASNPAGATSTEMLDKFMNYRMQYLSTHKHVVVHQISGLRMTGTDVGLAHLGKICQFSLGGGVNSDRDAAAINVAVTVAHELGHNLGFQHDEDEPGCACPDTQGCIMAAIGSEINPLKFSSCSMSRFAEYAIDAGLGYCLKSPPSAEQVAAAKSECGNRIVEAGEQCDCGLPQWCNNTCCNPSTCQFTSGANCASGECCDTSTCSVRTVGTECRSASGVCDLPEFCNGTSEWCPANDFMIDGTECSAGKAYCYNGECQDRDTRCANLFNGTKPFFAANASLAVLTTSGNSIGYCSYNESSLSPLNYTYTACSTANQRCGLLYCSDGEDKSTPKAKWKFMDDADMRIVDVILSGKQVGAMAAQLSLKYSGFRDPGLVPNGAECGTGKMCVNSECITTSSKTAGCPNCNGNGKCTKALLCFCDVGYAPPLCNSAGSGGSTSNPRPSGTVTPSGASAITRPNSAAVLAGQIVTAITIFCIISDVCKSL